MIFTIFTIFLYFSEFSMILFSIFNNKKINKKIKKWARGPRGCDVARKATWQRHVDPRSAPTWHEYILYSIILIYINGSYPYKTVGLFKPDGFIIIFRVGLKIFLTYLAGDVARRRASDRRRALISRVDRVSPDH